MYAGFIHGSVSMALMTFTLQSTRGSQVTFTDQPLGPAHTHVSSGSSINQGKVLGLAPFELVYIPLRGARLSGGVR